MSDFKIVGKKAKVDQCYGLEAFHITKEEIAALLAGKKLYSTVNCGEYAITIELGERVTIPKSKLEKNSKKLENPATKNNLGVDSISRDEVCRYVAEFVNHEFSTKEEEELINNIIKGIEHMSSATPQEPKSEWEHDHAILKAYSDGANEVLDKIRFDLFKLYNDRPSDYNHSQRTELFCEVIKILDKYTAESAHDAAQEIVKNNGVVDL